jgi:two-component system sensor histidine kinase KdpD
LVDRRPNPEELLRRVQAEERRERRGRLKVFLGYAPRVGKSFRMFDEGRRRKERGQDVVIGAIQHDVTPDVQDIVSRLEIMPDVDGAIDMVALFRRHPEVCLIDELAHDNPPGSRNRERWQDLDDLLDRGISVITAVNLQHIREHQDAVARITGKRAANSVPEEFLRSADEIEMVDAPPDTLLDRTGNSRIPDARALGELRELALLLAADVVDRQLQGYLDSHGVSARWGAQERILVCLTPRSNAAEMLRSGYRNAQRFHGALLAAYVQQDDLPAADRARLDQHLALARELGAEIHSLAGADFVDTLLAFAAEQRITQLFLGHTHREQRLAFLRSPVDRLIDAAEDFDLRIFPSSQGDE